MNAHGVEVLDRADHHAVVGHVAHDLELVFFPSSNGTLNQDLAHRAGHETFGRQSLEGEPVRSDASALATEDVGRSHHDRVPDLLGDHDGFLE